MIPKSPETGEILAKLIAKAIDGPAALIGAACVATLSVAKYIVGCVDGGMASDVRAIKDSLLRKIEAEGDAATADAKRRLADATEATNRATLHKRNDRIARAERAQLEAQAAKTQAEADATRSDAKTRRLQAEAEAQARLMKAQARLIDAIGKLRQEGGDIFFDREALQKMLGAGLPPEGRPDIEEASPEGPEQTSSASPSDKRVGAAWSVPDTASDAVREYIGALSEDHLILVAFKRRLYGGSWDPMIDDLRNRLAGKPYSFKLVGRIQDDIERVEEMRRFEIENQVDLADYVRDLKEGE